MSQIRLRWFEDIADVIEVKNGRSFEIGTVTVTRLANTVVGCDYYHHTLSSLENAGMKSSIAMYSGKIGKYQRDLQEIRKKLQTLHEDHPEISEKHMRLDDPDDPQFFDLCIHINFPVPFLPTEPYQATILEKIRPYIELLGTIHALEIIRE